MYGGMRHVKTSAVFYFDFNNDNLNTVRFHMLGEG